MFHDHTLLWHQDRKRKKYMNESLKTTKVKGKDVEYPMKEKVNVQDIVNDDDEEFTEDERNHEETTSKKKETKLCTSMTERKKQLQWSSLSSTR